MSYLAYIILKIRPAFLAALLKILIPFRWRKVSTPHGVFCVDIASLFGYELSKTGKYEEGTIDVLERTLRRGGVFVDLGANEGFFSVAASKLVGENGRVVAIEPQRRLQKIISRNLELNSCENVTILPVAIGDKQGESFLYVYPSVNTGASSLTRPTSYFLPRQKIGITTLERAFDMAGLDHCDLIKIDIEGGEYEAIFGSRKLFVEKRIRGIALELHPRMLAKRGHSEKEIIDFLLECGYNKENLFIL
ncbi:MAG: FkbM family methyltransferase [Candidatus Jorgensenbacteria bacterium]